MLVASSFCSSRPPGPLHTGWRRGGGGLSEISTPASCCLHRTPSYILTRLTIILHNGGSPLLWRELPQDTRHVTWGLQNAAVGVAPQHWLLYTPQTQSNKPAPLLGEHPHSLHHCHCVTLSELAVCWCPPVWSHWPVSAQGGVSCQVWDSPVRLTVSSQLSEQTRQLYRHQSTVHINNPGRTRQSAGQ